MPDSSSSSGPQSLANRIVMITGGGGFVGTELCRQIVSRSPAEIIVPRRAVHDLCEQGDVRVLFGACQPEVVIHLAAEVGGIGANRANPGRYFYANMMMGLNVIETSRELGVDKLVQVGTVCAYPKHTPVPFREDALWDGYPEETNAPYGIAKKALLVMLQSYRAQYGFNGIYLLPVNLYGPRDNFDLQSSHVIPALIRKMVDAQDASQESVDVWGTGSASREFLYVDDAARAILLATEAYNSPDPVNIGAGCEITIKDLVATIAKVVGYEGEIAWDSSKPDGQPRRMLDTSRAKAAFGFEAQVGFEEGLRRTVDWYRDHRS